MAASELLLEELKTPPARDLAVSIARSAENLNRRIDELLELARSEIGQIGLELASVDPVTLLEEINILLSSIYNKSIFD